ncbi:hypothetical protein HS088_TW09G01413 [Tripterygium wilfordii]|uniref:FBD domain-containing protein n=1 Tax=Tripterygium wilfordii TaxID=458696 RepID=A0A7J7DAE0_TRIWF|nr:hypothetical protein HS088_TW09G01413 [Tripterygium wilfordii]
MRRLRGILLGEMYNSRLFGAGSCTEIWVKVDNVKNRHSAANICMGHNAWKIARWNKHNVVMRRAKEVPDPHCPHKNLREVKIVGFTGLAVDNEIATYLIKNAFSLEKIILDTSAPTSVDNRWDHKDPMSIETAVKCAMGLKYRFALGNKLKLR